MQRPRDDRAWNGTGGLCPHRFEAIDMMRKFILVAGLALVQPGSTTQLMLAQLVCFGYVIMARTGAMFLLRRFRNY